MLIGVDAIPDTFGDCYAVHVFNPCFVNPTDLIVGVGPVAFVVNRFSNPFIDCGLLAFGSNPAFKPTRLRRAAYLGR